MNKWIVLIVLGCLISCKEEKKTSVKEQNMITEAIEKIILVGEKIAKKTTREAEVIQVRENRRNRLLHLDDEAFVAIRELSDGFAYDIKYATPDNFLKKAVYSCGECYIRGVVAKALIAANMDFNKQGYRIKFYDCYRPLSVQKKMWKIFPNPGYVANPKGGSVHNRGAAVDISLEYMSGKPVDMGSPYDHFGKESRHSYTGFSDRILKNRKILRQGMEKHGFETIRSEWWHYNYPPKHRFKVADFQWSCN